VRCTVNHRPTPKQILTIQSDQQILEIPRVDNHANELTLGADYDFPCPLVAPPPPLTSGDHLAARATQPIQLVHIPLLHHALT